MAKEPTKSNKGNKTPSKPVKAGKAGVSVKAGARKASVKVKRKVVKATVLPGKAGLEEHWAAPFYRFLPARIEDFDEECQKRLDLIQLDACRKLLSFCGPCTKEYPDLVNKMHLTIRSSMANEIQKISACIILDYCDDGWRDITPLEVLGPVITRDDPLVAKWRNLVLSRDGYVCTKCGNNKSLQAHHIIRWIDVPEARLLLENGTTLCILCHYEIHGKVYHGET